MYKLGGIRMKQRILRQGLTALLCFVLPVCLLLEVLSGTAFAKDRRTVKVAFFPMEGYHEKKENGKYAGMDVEYLEALCRYTDWEIKFVECASWDEALQLVAQKKADLVGSAQDRKSVV